MKISIIHPSYGRPELAMKTAANWIARAKHPENIEYLLCISNVDPKRFYYHVPDVDFLYCDEANMVKQMNLAAESSTGELIVSISDDFDCPPGWDDLLIGGTRGNKDFIVRVDDGIRNSGIMSKNIIPLPIMDRTYYNRFKYIYHPAYNHFYGDEELCRVGLILGRKVELPILFQHIHPVTGKVKNDHVNHKNKAFHQSDKETFFKREAEGFGLQSLSLLIPSLTSRAGTLNRLLAQLDKQVTDLKAGPLVQILKFTDGGERTIGRKRNKLLQSASGDYIAFIDDDDSVSDNYIQLLLSAIQSKPDCCSLIGNLRQQGKRDVVFKHSIQFKGWFEKEGVLYRFPNHLNCVKASIAKKMIFPDINHGEDKSYSEQLQASGLLKSEEAIHPVIYFYNYTNKK